MCFIDGNQSHEVNCTTEVQMGSKPKLKDCKVWWKRNRTEQQTQNGRHRQSKVRQECRGNIIRHTGPAIGHESKARQGKVKRHGNKVRQGNKAG